MDPNTGAVAKFENDADAKRAGHTVPVADAMLDEVLAMSRPQRVSWARANAQHQEGNRAMRRKRDKLFRKAEAVAKAKVNK